MLDSPASGSTTAGSATTGSTTSPAPAVRATRTSRSSYDLSVGRSDHPYWLVLNQTSNPGWSLHLAGHDLGASTLVNGYGNAWYVDPAALGITGRSVTATLDWGPQRLVWMALIISALGFLVCLALLLPRFHRPDPESGRRRPMRPIGISPVDTFGAVASVRTSALSSVGLGAVALVLAPWWSAPLLAGLTFAALRTGWGWRLLRVVVAGLLALTAAYVLARQWRTGYADDFDWPQHFAAVGSLPLVAFVGLAAEAVVEAVRGGWRRDTGLS